MVLEMPRIFFFLIFIISCSHLKTLRTKLTTVDFWKLQQHKLYVLDSFSTKFSISLSSVKDTLSGRASLISEKFEKIRLEITDPFGRIQFLATTLNGDFLASLISKKEIYTDTKGGFSYISSFFNIPLSLKELTMILFGVLPDTLVKKELGELEWLRDKNLYQMTLPNKSKWKILIGDEGNIREIFCKLEDREILITYFDYSNFETCEFPYEVELKVMPNETLLEVSIKHLKKLKNLDSRKYYYDIPHGFKQKFLE